MIVSWLLVLVNVKDIVKKLLRFLLSLSFFAVLHSGWQKRWYLAKVEVVGKLGSEWIVSGSYSAAKTLYPTVQQRHCKEWILQWISSGTLEKSTLQWISSGNWRKVYCSAFQVVHWRKIHCSVFQATSPSLFYWMSGSCSALQNIWEKCCNVILMKSRALE